MKNSSSGEKITLVIDEEQRELVGAGHLVLGWRGPEGCLRVRGVEYIGGRDGKEEIVVE
ncbi:MAG: hypothetical protein VCF24_13940 [Candidatus Latescibacterota bacterium]